MSSKEIEPSAFTMPYVDYDEITKEFVKSAYDHNWVQMDFDWPQWFQSREALMLRDDEATLARASAEQIAKLLTVIIRKDRFCEGELLAAFESGLILRIVRRVEALLETEK